MAQSYDVSNPNKSTLYSVIAVSFVALVVLLFAAGINGASQEQQLHAPTPVLTDAFSIQEGFSTPVKVIGLVESPQFTDVGFDNGGLLTQILVEEGSVVEKGQVLASLDTLRLDAQFKELQASLAQAEAELTLAKLGQQRVSQMVAQSLDSKQRKDESDANLAAASASVSGIKASIERLDVERKKSLLVAPFSGVVSARYLDEGAIVSIGAPIVRLTSDDALHARFAVPEGNLALFTTQETVTVFKDAHVLSGKVIQQLPIRNRQTRTVDLLVAIDATEHVIPGDILGIAGQKPHSETGAWISASALSNGLRGLWRVFVYEGETNTVEPRTVEVIYTDGTKAFVRGAIADGERYVTEGTHKLAPGQLVSLSGDMRVAGASR